MPGISYLIVGSEELALKTNINYLGEINMGVVLKGTYTKFSIGSKHF